MNKVRPVVWHAIYNEYGRRVYQAYFRAGPALEDAEREFKKLHPQATHWELGR